MAKEIKQWVTINGNHIPIYEGESKEDAYNRFVAKHNEDKKEADIAKNKEQADKLNNKNKKVESKPKEDKPKAESNEDKEIKKAKTYALFHGSPNADIKDFDLGKASSNTESGEKFLFFTDSQDMADEFSYERIKTESLTTDKKGKKGRVYEVDVTMKNPLDLTQLSDADIKNLLKMNDDGELTEGMISKFSKGNNQLLKTYINLNKIADFGYDGFIAKMNNKGDKEYAVLNNKQVKIRK